MLRVLAASFISPALSDGKDSGRSACSAQALRSFVPCAPSLSYLMPTRRHWQIHPPCPWLDRCHAACNGNLPAMPTSRVVRCDPRISSNLRKPPASGCQPCPWVVVARLSVRCITVVATAMIRLEILRLSCFCAGYVGTKRITLYYVKLLLAQIFIVLGL